MKLKQIRLSNFQSHADTTVDLHPGVNVIIGHSNVGKSAIFRALNWVLRNRPSGTGFIRHGQKEVEVTISSDEGCVLRQRGKSKNSYQVTRTGQRQMDF